MKKAITAIVVSYICEYGPQEINELINVVNMPVDYLTDYLFDLVEENILMFNKSSYRFELGENAQHYIVDIQDKNSDGVILQPYCGDEKYPSIESFEILSSYLRLEHINPTAYHVFRVEGKKRQKIDSNRPTKKHRDIAAPSIELKKRQKWILDNILIRYQCPDCVHGFVKGKSIVTNARCHINQREIGCLDIKDFFPSINYKMVLKVFLDMGYSGEVANSLTILTTYYGKLPQGAPTSPMLSNIVMKPLDIMISEYAKENNLVYTRYADDITISGEDGIDRHLKSVAKIIEEYGFKINKKKSHTMNSKSGKKVTGLSVDTSVKVPQQYKRKLRQEIYFCNKYGISFHLGHSQTKDSRYVNFIGYLYGKAYYIRMVEPSVGDAFLKQLDDLFGYEPYNSLNT